MSIRQSDYTMRVDVRSRDDYLIHRKENGEDCEKKVYKIIDDNGNVYYECGCGRKWKSSEAMQPE